MTDGFRILRRRQEVLAAFPPIRPDVQASGAVMLGQVYNAGSIPSTVPGQFAVRPVRVTGGTESEGSTYTTSADTSRAAVFTVLGPQVPTAGDILIGHLVGGRWVARKGTSTGGGISTPTCGCLTTPATINMVSSDHVSNFARFQDATFVYGPTAAGYTGLGLGANSWVSTADIYDTTTASDTYRYHLFCFGGSYLMDFVYVTSIYGTPHRSITMYSWNPLTPGQTCSPFHYANGTVYAGGSALNITLDG